MNDTSGAKKQADRRSGVLEWSIAAASGLAVAVLFGFLLFEALTASDAPPTFTTHPAFIREAGGLYYVTVTVNNDGPKAAADVTVTGDLQQQTASATLDYAPANSQSEVTLVFSEPVEQDALRLRVESFREP